MTSRFNPSSDQSPTYCHLHPPPIGVHTVSSSGMEFCPTCGNLLQYEMRIPARLFCRTCPYVSPIERKVKIRRQVQLPDKKATPIAVGEKNVGPTTEAPCPKCRHNKAAFHQMQTRSADEPMTIFYKCLNESCGHQWRED